MTTEERNSVIQRIVNATMRTKTGHEVTCLEHSDRHPSADGLTIFPPSEIGDYVGWFLIKINNAVQWWRYDLVRENLTLVDGM